MWRSGGGTEQKVWAQGGDVLYFDICAVPEDKVLRHQHQHPQHPQHPQTHDSPKTRTHSPPSACRNLFDYDQVVNTQRDKVYAERRRAVLSNDLAPVMIEYAEKTMDDIFEVRVE